MEYRFMKHQEIIEKLPSLLERWEVGYNILSKLSRDDLSTRVKSIKEKIKNNDAVGAAEEVRELGAVIENIHSHLQDLESIYYQMWNLIKDS